MDARPKKEAILDLSRFKDQRIRIKYMGGREVEGTLQGWDALMNLVLVDAVEHVRGLFSLGEGEYLCERVDTEKPGRYTGEVKQWGTIVSRGPSLSLLSPVDGSEVIENPFSMPE